METFKQARDLLEWVRDYHRRMKEGYGAAAETAADERAALLFRYLQTHEAAFEDMIGQAVTEHGDTLETWIQYTPDKEILESVAGSQVDPDLSAKEVAVNAQRMDEALVTFYRHAVERIKTRLAREAFEQLLEQQKSDRAKLAEHLQSVDRGI